jgi:Endonuclease/Exonuclease/phosphatase family
MGMQLSIATWNLERPAVRSWKKLPAIRSRLALVSADCWVLTETRASIAPGDDYRGIHSPVHLLRRPDPDERWVSVWSRWPLKAVPVRETPWSTTGLLETEFGQLLLHGIVLPYHAEPGIDGGRAPQWAEFSNELTRQAEDWVALRSKYPGIPMIVAGDFNQILDGSRPYGTPATQRQLRLALDGGGLRCLTIEDVVASGKLKRNHLVDHICVSPELSGVYQIECWDPVRDDGTRMSDHPGVVARLSANRPPTTVSR